MHSFPRTQPSPGSPLGPLRVLFELSKRLRAHQLWCSVPNHHELACSALLRPYDVGTSSTFAAFRAVWFTLPRGDGKQYRAWWFSHGFHGPAGGRHACIVKLRSALSTIFRWRTDARQLATFLSTDQLCQQRLHAVGRRAGDDDDAALPGYAVQHAALCCRRPQHDAAADDAMAGLGSAWSRGLQSVTSGLQLRRCPSALHGRTGTLRRTSQTACHRAAGIQSARSPSAARGERGGRGRARE